MDERYDVLIRGTSPLLQHRFNGEQRTQRTGQNYDNEQLARDSRYCDSDGNLVQPALHLEASMIKAAANFRFQGKKTYKELFKSAVFVEPDNIPHRIQEWSVDERPVVVSRARIIRARARLETETANGKDASKRTIFETINEYIEFHSSLVGSNIKLNTFKDKQRILNRFAEFAGSIKLQDLKRRHIMEYKQKRYARGARIRTVNCDIAYLSHFLNWCRDRDYYIGNNPAERMKEKEENIRFILLSSEQMNELFEKAERKMYTATALAVHAGLRKQEVINLEWQDIDFTNDQIWIKPENSKGRKDA